MADPAAHRGAPIDVRHVTTDRLDLRAVRTDDLDVLYALHVDPRVWQHAPWARHASRDRTSADVAEYLADWSRDGLGYWTAWRPAEGPDAAAFVGIGGVRLRPTGVFNVYYRITPHEQGHGFAVEIARAGMAAAAQVRPDAPVTAILLEHNIASRRTAERLGLTPVWAGPDAGNPDPDAVRLIYADRALDDAVAERLVAR